MAERPGTLKKGTGIERGSTGKASARMTHRKGEKELNDKVEKTRKGRFLVIVGEKSVHTVKLPKQRQPPGVRRMERSA